MEILRSRAAIENYIKRQKQNGNRIGFAPTMGALHDGHLSLYRKAEAENDIVISSIFINPTQFNNPDDLAKYPRTEEADIKLLEGAGVDAVYLPRIEDLYPDGAASRHYDYDGLEHQMEGKFRPGHFDGVGTVVETLLRQVQPDRAYFGEKDFQQLAIIRKLQQQLELPVAIEAVEIRREPGGLAMSSRNVRLSEEQRAAAVVIYETLLKVRDWFKVISIDEIQQRVAEIFSSVEGFRLEYFTIADEETLRETDFFYTGHNYRAFIAVFAGDIRLIDNIAL
ncbi:MAG: pantoate--beta-alanine ligase [Chryseobacterium sp.]|nr:MAG: pantoate--beta-alanine ligase [Chryseobacterium sp.]